MKKAAFYTLGCKVNQYETEAMSELFEKSGYEIVDFNSPADVYVINTCSVTSMSDRKSRQMIRRANKLNPSAIIAVAGCYSQTAPDKVAEIEGVNLVLGTQDRGRIVELTEEISNNDCVNKVCDIMKNHTYEDLAVSTYSDRTRAYIKIQEGCNQFCSYCIIPYARGPIRSRELSDITDEVKKLASRGFTEIILTGIHVASYGLDKKDGTNLAVLLNTVNSVDGIRRIRLSSIEPMTLDEKFIEQIKDCTKLCPHFHISLQSGCDETLKRMNRKYTVSQYKSIVDGLRAHYKNPAITTDVMVGFPGETDEEFNKTLDFINEINFSDIHIFQYSQRPGTPAAEFPQQIAPETKERRSKAVEAAAERSRAEFLKKHIGKIEEVLFEQRKDDMFEGKTSNYITVMVKSDIDLSGQYKKVFLEKIINNVLYGVIL